MGKLHKIRHLYGKLDKEQKMAMAIYFGNGMQKDISKEKLTEVINLIGFGKEDKWDRPYRYYFKALLKKDGCSIKPTKVTMKVVHLFHRKNNELSWSRPKIEKGR